MTDYILHVSLLLGLGFILYQVLLKKETFYSLNRIILSSYLILAFSLPLIHIPQSWSLRDINPLSSQIIATQSNQNAASHGIIEKRPNLIIANEPIASNANTTKNNGALLNEDSDRQAQELIAPAPTFKEKVQAAFIKINWAAALKWTYIIGLSIFLINFLVQFGILVYYRLKYPILQDGKLTIVEMDGDKAPFSFLNMIYINPGKYDYDTYEQILAHEKIHIEKWHSLDIFLSELALIVLWFNPFAWMYRKVVEHNLEYLTDQEMLASGANAEVYQMNLLKVSVPELPLSLSTNYNQSFLKKRIHMMNAKKSSARSTWKYLFILPILGLTITLFNPTLSTAQITNPETQEFSESIEEYSTPQEIETQVEIQNEVENTEEIETQSEYIKTSEKTEATSQSSNQEETSSVINDLRMINIDPKVDLSVSKIDNGFSIISSDNQTYRIDKESNKTIVTNGSEILNNTGSWEADINGNKVCLHIKKKGNGHDYYWSSSECFNMSDFSPAIRPNSEGEFTLTRDPGTLSLNGKFSSNDGEGQYSFTPNTNFISEAKNQGFTIRERKLIHFFLSGMEKSFFVFLKSNGYTKVDEDELLALAVHDVNEEYIKNINSEFKKANYDQPDVDELVALKIHDVDMEYIKSFGKELFEDLDVDQIIAAAIHNVDPKYISEFRALGFDDLDFDDLIAASIHNVDVEYVRELKGAGFKDMDFDDLISAAIHNVNPAYIKKFQNAGFTDLDFDDMIAASIHNVDPNYIEAFKAAGLELDFDDLISASIHNVDVEYIQSFKNAGFDELDFDDLIAAAIHNVDVEYVKEAQKHGFDLSMDELVSASIHNVNLDYLQSFKAAGFDDLDFDDLIAASIHNVDPSFITEFKALGFDDLDFDDLIAASIHNVSIDHIKGFKEAGMSDVDFDDFISASIHNVSPGFIKKVKDAGLQDVDFDDIISFSIHNVNVDDIKRFKEMGFDLDADELIAARIHNLTPKYIKKMQDKGHKGLSFDEYLELKVNGF
ncbi:MAG: M56 family metallopeptidase [Bacteroidota bacterium]